MTPQRTGILAGGGNLPREIAAAAAASGDEVHVVIIDGEGADPSQYASARVTVVNWGQIGRMVRTFQLARVDRLVIVGQVNRPDLLRIKPDWGFFASLPRVARMVVAGGDDHVLRKVVRFFEGHRLKVVSPADVVPALLIASGPVGRLGPDAESMQDTKTGLALVRALGSFDIGQAVVVREGKVVAIEAAEGTDRMLARLSAGTEPGGPRSGVLVKRPKPGQELRIDLPAIGPQTVEGAARGNLAGISVLAGKVLAVERERLIAAADRAGVFVAGVIDPAPQDDAPRSSRAKGQGLAIDAETGFGVLDALKPFLIPSAVVVARRHVIAIEAGEGFAAAIERARGLRQWGRGVRGRRGVFVVPDAGRLTSADVRWAAAAGLAGLAVGGSARCSTDMQAEVRSCGLALIERGQA